VALEGANLCAACLSRPPAFDRARALLAYDENSRGAILAFKHAGWHMTASWHLILLRWSGAVPPAVRVP